jgi:hypothetical protein
LLEVLYRGGARLHGWALWMHPFDERFGQLPTWSWEPHGFGACRLGVRPLPAPASLGRPADSAAVHRPGALAVKDQAGVRRFRHRLTG